MRRKVYPKLMLILLPLSACAAVPPPERGGPPPAAVKRAVTIAAQQVKKCYRSPRVPSAGKRIVTRLRVRYAPDGTLSGIPDLITQLGVTPENRPYAGRMAEAATVAVIRCSPMHLPPELHRGGWDEFELTFSHSVLA